MYIATASIIAALFNLVTNYIFIPRYGYISAGFTTLASYFVLLLVNYCFGIKLGINKVYDIKRFCLWTVFIALYAVICVGLKNAIVIRYGIFVVITIVLLAVKAKDLLRLVKSLR